SPSTLSLVYSLSLHDALPIYGNAGALLGLLQIYSLLPNEEILKNINLYLHNLIENYQIANQGIYWDRGEKDIRSLCGFSHGTSGDRKSTRLNSSHLGISYAVF